MSANKRKIEEDDRNDTPQEIREAAQKVTENLLPDKSAQLYKLCYTQFREWQEKKKTTSTSEDTMLVYFHELSTKMKPSSVWSKYSMLKSTIQNFHHVNIGKYSRLIALLTKNGKGYAPKKSKILEPEHVEKFLAEAPDEKYLSTKVALIFGVTGACRRDELKKITVNDIEHHENLMMVKIPRTKNDVPRKFVIDGEFYKIVKKYEALRPTDASTEEFFLTLRNGKCTCQVIGINTFGSMPKAIAEYLCLENPELYTGHTFRRTSATMLANAGADLLTLKRHGGWKSDQVAQGYVEDSVTSKKKICNQISSAINLNRRSSIAPGMVLKSTENEGEMQTSVSINEPGLSKRQDYTKENISSAANVPMDERREKRMAIELTNCNVTFNFTKD